MSSLANATCEMVVAWAEGTPRIRRVWICGSREDAVQSDSTIELAV